ncbi:hypothetical protein [Flavobacterium sp.]|uniref:hypothetical protein n=1 Tax=Flavobacterium sp. TaxID=239 RepID=UPI0025F49961|nr:hypothetical protein [Flavobacterium sp.]
MKLYILFFLMPLFIFCQVKQNNDIYIIGRGTISKKKFVGDIFNNINKNITHIGIGFLESDSLMVYNVSLDKRIKNSSLIVEGFADFKNVNDLFYMGVWKLEISKTDLLIVKERIKEIQKKEIVFDSRFDLDNGDTNLYCSEFVQIVINSIDNYYYFPTEMILKNSLKTIINKDTFLYFPTDFFLVNNKFQQVDINQLNFKL